MNFYLEVAERLIRRKKRPMGPTEMAEIAAEQQLYSDTFHGKTPQKSFHARLSTEILQNGLTSKFIRTAPGQFFLRDLLRGGNSGADLEVFRAPRRSPSPPSERVWGEM